MAPNYRDRRYRIIDGKVKKQFDTPAPDGWYVTKAEAWEVWNAAEAAAPKTSQEAEIAVGYQKRRYKVIDGKLAKKWDTDPTWFVTKDEAWAAHAAESAEPEARQDAKEPPETAAQINKPRQLIDGGTITITPAPPEPGEGAAPESEAPEPELERPDLAAAQRVLRVPAVIELTGLSRTTIFRRVKTGTFVAPLDLGNGHIGWLETEILAWQRDQPGAAEAPESKGVT